jgi:hypothetical protein
MSFATVMSRLSVLLAALIWTRPAAAAPVEVRFTEGVGHAFLLLRTLDGTQIAAGDLLQVVRGEEIESRMVFHFKDGSLLDETVVFTQDGVFEMRSYRLLQRGPAFAEDTELVLERASGKYSVTTGARRRPRQDCDPFCAETPSWGLA